MTKTIIKVSLTDILYSLQMEQHIIKSHFIENFYLLTSIENELRKNSNI